MVRRTRRRATVRDSVPPVQPSIPVDPNLMDLDNESDSDNESQLSEPSVTSITSESSDDRDADTPEDSSQNPDVLWYDCTRKSKEHICPFNRPSRERPCTKYQ